MADKNQQEINALYESVGQLAEVLQSLEGLLKTVAKASSDTLSAFTTMSEEVAKAAVSAKKLVEEKKSLNEQLSSTSINAKETAKSVQSLKTGLESLSATNKEQTNTTSSLTKEQIKAKKEMEELTKKIEGANTWSALWKNTLKALEKKFPRLAKGVKAFGMGVSFMATIVRGAFGIIGSLVKMLGSLAMVIISLPFQLFGEFMKMLQETIAINVKLRQSTEELKGEFGNLDRGIGALVNRSRNVREVNRAFAEMGLVASGTGSEMYTVFGHLVDGEVAITRAMGETAKSLGALGHALANQLGTEGLAKITRFRIGLQLADDQIQGIINHAQMAGRDIVQEFNDINIAVETASQAFGISAHVIAQDVGTMSSQYGTFGNMSRQTMINTSIHMRRLGLEIKDVVGLITGFDDFEKAADSAAMLAQGLGMNVDAMDLFSAQDPNQRLELLRRSFAETGRSIQSLSRQELRFLAAQSNMDEATLQRAFSQEGLAMSYDDLQSASANAQENAVSQTEAMIALANAIKQMTEAPVGGFWASFSQGIRETLINSRAFRRLGGSVEEIQRKFQRFGRDIANLFLNSKLFERIITGIENLLDPRKFTAFFDGLLGDWNTFWSAFTSGDPNALSNFFSSVISRVRELFGLNGDGGGLLGLFGFTQESWANFTEVWGNRIKNNLKNLWENQIWPFLRDDVGPKLKEGIMTLLFGAVTDPKTGKRTGEGLVSMLTPSIWRVGFVLGGLFFARMFAGWLAGKAAIGALRFVAGFVSSLRGVAVTGALTQAGAGMANTTAQGAAQAARAQGPLMARAGAGLGQFLASSIAGQVALVAAAGAAGYALGTIIDRTLIGPYREGMSRFREEMSNQSNEDLLKTRENLRWYEFNRSAEIDRLLVQRAHEAEQTESILEPVRAAAAADREILDGITNEHGVIAEEFRERRLQFERELQVLNMERPADRAERTWWGGMREVRVTEAERAAFEERVAALRNQYSDVAGQVERGRELVAESASASGAALSAGMAEGIRRGNEEIGNAAVGGVQGALESVQREAEIRSPSEKTAREIGLPLAQGIAEGIKSFDFSFLSNFFSEHILPYLSNVTRDSSTAMSNLRLSDTFVSPFREGLDRIRSIFQTNLPAESARNLVGDIASGFSGIEEMGDILARPFRSVLNGNLFGEITSRFSRGVSDVSTNTQSAFTREFNDRLLANVTRLSREYSDLDTVLARGIPTVRLSGTLDRFNQAINVARDTITIEQRPVNINVELHVTLDSEALAYALTDPMSPYPLMPGS